VNQAGKIKIKSFSLRKSFCLNDLAPRSRLFLLKNNLRVAFGWPITYNGSEAKEIENRIRGRKQADKHAEGKQRGWQAHAKAKAP